MKFNALVPELEVTNLQASLRFYVEMLGFKVEFDRPASKFVYLSFHESQMMICQADGNGEWETTKMEKPFGRGMHFQMLVPSIDQLLKPLKEHAISILGPYESWFPVKNELVGVREFLVQDPDGYLLRFQEDIGSKENVDGLAKSSRVEI